MKLLTTLFLAALTTAAQAQQTSGTATISGRVEGARAKYVICYHGQDTDEEGMDTIMLNKDMSFSAKLKVGKPGAAFLMCPEAGSTTFFLEPGSETRFDISVGGTKDKPTYTLKTVEGDNIESIKLIPAVDSTLFDAWPIERLSTMSFKDYRAGMLHDLDLTMASVNKAHSAALRGMLKTHIQKLLPLCLLRYGWSKDGLTDKDFEDFAESIDRNDPEGMDLTSDYLLWHMKRYPLSKTGNSDIEQFKMFADLISNTAVRDSFAVRLMEATIRDAPRNLDKTFTYFKNFVANKSLVARLQPMYDHYIKLKPGAEAVDFTMTDTKGKEWKLSDMRGKAVYIDCWATWCGPCVMEIPHMKELYEHFKNDKRIRLISISLDTDRKKWMAKLKADKPGWEQFICPENFNSALAKNYNIDGIPRFLFFDKDGRVISLDAPRPSSKDIIEFIERGLK